MRCWSVSFKVQSGSVASLARQSLARLHRVSVAWPGEEMPEVPELLGVAVSVGEQSLLWQSSEAPMVKAMPAVGFHSIRVLTSRSTRPAKTQAR